MSAVTVSRRAGPRRERARRLSAVTGSDVRPGQQLGHPAQLGRMMRARLRHAVHALLKMPGMKGLTDTCRLVVMVLVAKTNASRRDAQISARELGRWLGLGESTIRAALAALRTAGLLHTLPQEEETPCGDSRHQVLPLHAALTGQTSVGDPLALHRDELAVLLRLLDHLFAPGWRRVGAEDIPAGLLAAQRGRGASTDRLALLLLVLEAGPSGWVRLCPGRIRHQRGRPAETLARLLGCKAAGAEAVLERLAEAGMVTCRRRETRSGLHQSSRLQVVPLVSSSPARTAGTSAVPQQRRAPQAPALETVPAPDSPAEEAFPGPSAYFSDPDVAGGPEAGPDPDEESQVNAAEMRTGAAAGDPGDVGGPHAGHPVGVSLVEESADGLGFSGNADLGEPERCRDRAGGREEIPHQSAEQHPSSGGAGVGALRAEQHNLPPLHPQLATRLPRLTVLLAEAMAPVNGFQRDRLSRVVTGLLADGEDDLMLAARLRRRLAKIATGDVERPYAFRRDGYSWALTVGLPYAPGEGTPLPCRNRGCPNLVRTRPTWDTRCDRCEVEATQTARARPALLRALDSPLPPPAQPVEVPANVPVQAAPADDEIPHTEDAEPDTGLETEPAVVPATVREQLAVIAAVDPSAARAAERAVEEMYGPHRPGESAEQHRDRITDASSVFNAVLTRHTTLIAEHYVGSAA